MWSIVSHCISNRSLYTNFRTFSTIATSIQEALSKGKLYTDQEQYAFLKLPITAFPVASNLLESPSSSFQGILFDKDEITVMIPYHNYVVNQSLLHDAEVGSSPYRLITFDIVLDPNLIGFMHAVTKALAAEKISVLPFAAYSRDHIFVQEKDFEKAMTALERLKNDSSDP